MKSNDDLVYFQMKVKAKKEDRRILKAFAALTDQSYHELFKDEIDRIVKKAREMGLK